MLNAKLCPYCNEYSYSAYIGAQWICPKCGKDITDVGLIPAENNS